MRPTRLGDLAYIACSRNERGWFETSMLGHPHWPDVQLCCEALTFPSAHGHLLPADVALIAAACGHTFCVRRVSAWWSLGLGYRVIVEAARHGHALVIGLVYRRHFRGHHWLIDCACVVAARHNRLRCLMFVHLILGGRLSSAVSSTAAYYGYMDLLVYAAENGGSRTVETCTDAVKGGQYECLVYAHRRGYPWNASTYRAATVTHHHPDVCRARRKCLEYMRRKGCPRY